MPLIGQHHSEEGKRKISMNSAKIWLGKHLSKEHKRKLSISHLGKGNPQSLNHKRGEESPHYGKKHSLNTRKKMSMTHQQIENEKEWTGFRHNKDYLLRRKFRREIQKQIFERDNYQCISCGSGKDLQVDHIQSWAEYIELRFNMDNCRTLCAGCHYQITYGRPMPENIKGWGHNLLKGRVTI